MLLACKNISKSFGEQDVLKNVSFILEEKEKAAIVGINGAGKTTLMRIIQGTAAPDAGETVYPREASMGALSQLSDLNGDNTVYEEMLTVFSAIIETECELRRLEAEMSSLSGEPLERAMARYSTLTHDFEAADGYAYKSRIRGVIKGLGFADEESEQLISTFSGGQKTRVAMAKLLLSQPALLLLDEPTNHLDMAAVSWLEEFLKGYAGSVLLVSHDRYFMDKVVTKVIDLENGVAAVYMGDYTTFVKKKAADRDVQLRHYVNQAREIKRQEEVIRVLKSYNREKSIKRAESREKLLDKVERLDKPTQSQPIRVMFAPARESGNDVLAVEGVSKAFGTNRLFGGVSFKLKKGEKAALIGPNGIGKTTLLRIITGELPADSGTMRFGARVSVGYFEQAHESLDLSKTVTATIADAFPHITTGEIRNALATFAFTGDDVFKPVSALSGGERGRLSLLRLMLGGFNFLILDEPTNHLDIASVEVLEAALQNYAGTMLYVSHDRYFINRTATKVIALDGESAKVYDGGYDYYMEKAAENDAARDSAETPAAGPPQEENERLIRRESAAAVRRRKALLAQAERSITTVEGEIAQLTARLESPELAADHEALLTAYEERAALEEKLMNLYKQWEDLSLL